MRVRVRLDANVNEATARAIKGLCRQMFRLGVAVEMMATKRSGFDIVVDLTSRAKSLRTQFRRREKELGLRKGEA